MPIYGIRITPVKQSLRRNGGCVNTGRLAPALMARHGRAVGTMQGKSRKMTRLLILRHAAPLTGGRLAGRTDVDADCSDAADFDWIRARIGQIGHVLSSPARRCLQTAEALSMPPHATSQALWEQDYGAWEGLAYGDLPDLGPLPPARLSRHRPAGGESFDDMAARVLTELRLIDRDTLIVGHAGTVRAALSMVVGPAALSFAVAPLSLTVLRRAGDDWAVEFVNVTAP